MSNRDMDTSSGPGGGGGGNSQDMSKRQGLIQVNDLSYVLEPDLSVASNKTHKNHFFQSAEYSSDQAAICILNSGADYIDTRSSWLQFDVDLTVDAPDGAVTGDPLAGQVHGSFGAHGSACNLIDSIVISTRSGDELCHLFDFNLMQNMLVPLAYGKEWVDSVGKLMGMGGVLQNNSPAGTRTKRFCIPMYILAPLFGYGRLMPSMLMSGMRIEINWSKPQTAYAMETSSRTTTAYAAPQTRSCERGSNYKIKNPQFVLSSVQLSDSIQRALNELSATNGLEIVYTDYAHTSGSASTNLETINTEIRKSCSRALKAFARVRNIGYGTAKFDNHGVNGASVDPIDSKGRETANDSLRSDKHFPFKEYQWQLGSLYFPQQPVSGGNAGGDPNITKKCAVSAYAHLLEAVGKYNDNSAIFNSFSGVSAGPGSQMGGYYDQMDLANVPTGEFVSGHGFNGSQTTIAVTLERSAMFNLAGVPVNNSRVLALRAKLDPRTYEHRPYTPLKTSAKTTRQLDIFLKYVKLARVFLNNVEVEQ